MPKTADPSLKQGKTYKSKRLSNAKYTGEGLDKYVEDGTITPEEAKELKEKVWKSVRLRMPADLKEKLEMYVKNNKDKYNSMNDFICKTLAEKIKEN